LLGLGAALSGACGAEGTAPARCSFTHSPAFSF